jgi:MFS family permease
MKGGVDTVERDQVLILYASMMVFLLAIGYILIITNPPSDLLQYDNFGNAHTIDNLPLTKIPEHWGSVLIFWGLFAFLAFFIGLAMAVVNDVLEREEVKGKINLERQIILSMSLLLLVLLALLLWPYYGGGLTSTLAPIGYLFGLIGMSFSKSLRKQFYPHILIMLWILLGLIEFLVGLISAQMVITGIKVLFLIETIVLIPAYILRLLKRRQLRQLGALMCIAAIVIAVAHIYFGYVKGTRPSLAFALPVTVGLLLVLGLGFWLGWIMATTKEVSPTITAAPAAKSSEERQKRKRKK